MWALILKNFMNTLLLTRDYNVCTTPIVVFCDKITCPHYLNQARYPHQLNYKKHEHFIFQAQNRNAGTNMDCNWGNKGIWILMFWNSWIRLCIDPYFDVVLPFRVSVMYMHFFPIQQKGTWIVILSNGKKNSEGNILFWNKWFSNKIISAQRCSKIPVYVHLKAACETNFNVKIFTAISTEEEGMKKKYFNSMRKNNYTQL